MYCCLFDISLRFVQLKPFLALAVFVLEWSFWRNFTLQKWFTSPSLLGVRISELHGFTCTLCIKWDKATNYKINIIINHAAMGWARFMFYPWFIFFIFFLSDTRRRSPLGQLWITQSVMFTRQTLFLQGQQKSQITKSRRTYTLQKNLFRTLTSKRYITLTLIATTHRQKVNLFLNNPALSC